MRLRVLSYNIHKGFSASNTRFTLDKIKEAIRGVGADLVFLQEVQGRHDTKAAKHNEWPEVSQFEYLADEVWPHYAYGKNAIYDVGHHGNAILSKFPIVSWENVDISTNLFEQRGILHAEIEIPNTGQRLHCFCLHLNILQGGRRLQINEICKFVRARIGDGGAALIAGDFNDWSRRASAILEQEIGVKELFKTIHGRYAKSYPSGLPLLNLDRIYFSGVTAIEARIVTEKLWVGLSDHIPLIGMVEI